MTCSNIASPLSVPVAFKLWNVSPYLSHGCPVISEFCSRLSRAEVDNAIRCINNCPVDNAIGFPRVHKKLSGRWIVIYPVDRRYPTFKQMYGARALRCSLRRVCTRRLVMSPLHNILYIYSCNPKTPVLRQDPLFRQAKQSTFEHLFHLKGSDLFTCVLFIYFVHVTVQRPSSS